MTAKKSFINRITPAVCIFAICAATFFTFHTPSNAGDNKPEKTALATFAGGCFWCIEAAFQKLEGVHAAVSGYSGGQIADPTYPKPYLQPAEGSASASN